MAGGTGTCGWFNSAGRSTINAPISSKTERRMFEAYRKRKSLKALEARLPNEAELVKKTLETEAQDTPSDDQAMLVLARCQVLCGEPEAAKQTLQALISRKPGQETAKVELAKTLASENDLWVGIKLLGEVTKTRPDLDENWLLLGEYLERDGQLQASKDALNQYDMIKAFNGKLKEAEGAFSNGEFLKADKICRHLLSLVPGEVRTLRMLARIAKRFHHFEISTSILAQCLETQPGNAALRLEYAYSLLAGKKHQEALEQCHRLIETSPEEIDTYELMAEVLYNLNQFEEAIAIYRELSGVSEKRVKSLLHLGKVFKAVGETTQAISCYHEAMKDKVLSGHAYWELANLKTYRFSANEISGMQALLKSGENTAINKVLIQFALGKALEDNKRFAESFQHYQAANNAYTKIQPFSNTYHNKDLKTFFTLEYFSEHKESGSIFDAPIFVVGLPRSGSTLVEQILTSHSMVDATRELAEIISITRDLINPNQSAKGKYPQSIANLTAKQIQGLAQRYLDFVQTFRQQAPYFVDKAPANFHHIGLIKTLFPNAKIIDIRRHPMASGWSLYRQFFADSFLFSYDLASIGKYYNDYIELMDHWHSVLPNQILTIKYEALINDFPVAVGTLLEYCGLPFEQACLDFHLNKRPVATPSSEQVRKPIYAEALEHWKNYEEFLTPLKNVIGLK
jgi:tetratricopeptide (TPR) repeat protein